MSKIEFEYKSLDEVKFNNLVSLWKSGLITIKKQQQKIKELEKEIEESNERCGRFDNQCKKFLKENNQLKLKLKDRKIIIKGWQKTCSKLKKQMEGEGTHWVSELIEGERPGWLKMIIKEELKSQLKQLPKKIFEDIEKKSEELRLCYLDAKEKGETTSEDGICWYLGFLDELDKLKKKWLKSKIKKLN